GQPLPEFATLKIVVPPALRSCSSGDAKRSFCPRQPGRSKRAQARAARRVLAIVMRPARKDRRQHTNSSAPPPLPFAYALLRSAPFSDRTASPLALRRKVKQATGGG
ncbi:MAG: hypothetical protein NTY86_10335, partial [Deltaproteobacteria bacterium]|nr:hypothetical protein [Deltaproteobacteria bacterium]